MVKKLGIYLTDQTTNKTIQLPVNPKEFKLKYETDDHSETVTNLGEVNLIGNLKLTSLSIESVFPYDKPHYLALADPLTPDDYIKQLKSIQSKKHKVRLVISTTKVSILMTISGFEYGYTNAYMGDYAYTLELKQYRKFSYKKINSPKAKGKKSGKTKKRSSPAKKVSIGSTVKVNGRLHADSYGRGAGQYEKNATRKILYICPGRKYPVCVGIGKTARGWVKMSEVKKA
ncbi:hypothetical protein [uncultured Lactobacillus sp.]|uniref:hypothetical protein n=1 Tax=uncultured Lactobacillus sp. TaxID=153152 RepID=UPI00262C7D0D|nr:hypothetical protein [uncultured Lactobacillus sp.]